MLLPKKTLRPLQTRRTFNFGMTSIPTDQRARTLAELAALAGVSAGTASRALANSTLVNIETRDKIQALAKQHGFRPNQMARRLRTQRTGAIGIVIPLGHDRRQHISDPFFMTMLGHLADALTERGYDVVLSRIIPDNDEWLVRITTSGMLDGVLLIGQSDQFAVIERVAAEYLPLVVWGHHAKGQVHCSVGTDNRAGGRLAAEHLLSRGCRAIAYVGDPHPPEIVERLAGCRAAVEAAGAQLQVLETHFARDALTEEIAALLDKGGTGFDGIVAASDVIAMATLGALAERGVAVPGQVRIVGYDDVALAARTVPPLTTIKQDIARGANAMIEALFQRMAGQATPSLIMPPELIVRKST